MIHILSSKNIDKYIDKISSYKIIFNRMLSLCNDLYLIICKDFSNKEKISISMVAKKLNQLKYIFIYFDEANFDAIEKLSYFNNFTNVKVGKEYVGILKSELLPIRCEWVHVTADNDISSFETIDGKRVKISHVTFDDDFDDSLANVRNIDELSGYRFPESATHLTFGDKYNRVLICLSKNIIYLEFGRCFDKIINPYQLLSVQYLKFGKFYNQDFNFFMLDNLKHLTFGDEFNRCVTNKLPLSITHLVFGNNFNQIVNFTAQKNLTHLTLGVCFNNTILKCLPQFLTHLTLGQNFNQPIKGAIPMRVTHLTFGTCFNQPINKCIPKSVTHLIFGDWFNQPVDGLLPSSIIELTFGSRFNKPINNIPASVRRLTFTNKYNFVQQIPVTVIDLFIAGTRIKR
jgi:hypothetical protein